MTLTPHPRTHLPQAFDRNNVPGQPASCTKLSPKLYRNDADREIPTPLTLPTVPFPHLSYPTSPKPQLQTPAPNLSFPAHIPLLPIQPLAISTLSSLSILVSWTTRYQMNWEPKNPYLSHPEIPIDHTPDIDTYTPSSKLQTRADKSLAGLEKMGHQLYV